MNYNFLKYFLSENAIDFKSGSCKNINMKKYQKNIIIILNRVF